MYNIQAKKNHEKRKMLPVTDEAHDPELLALQQAPNSPQSQSSGPQLPVNKYQRGMKQNWRPASSFLKCQTSKTISRSYEWQSIRNIEPLNSPRMQTWFFCAEKKCLGSQLLSGRDRDTRSLLEMWINTDSRLQVRNSRPLYHRVALANFIHQLKEKVRNNHSQDDNSEEV